MKKILFIDPICQFGHNNLNRIYISTLIESGYKVELVLKEDYIKDLCLPDNLVKYSIPGNLFNGKTGKINNRFIQLKLLIRIKRKIDLKEYDYIFFSSFEEISLYLSGIRGNLLLLNHGNGAGLENFLKRYFIKQLSKRGTFIVFHEFIKNHFDKFGINKVKVESLGLSKPFKINKDDAESILLKIDNRLISSNFKHIIFAPWGSKYSDQFIKETIIATDFIKFIEANQILLIVKDQKFSSESSHIMILKNYLSELEYQTIFNVSSCILLHYPKAFNYRVSAILFECFSNNKPTILSDIEGFRAFSSNFTYNPFYSNKQELILVIKHLLLFNISALEMPYKNIEQFKVKFEYL